MRPYISYGALERVLRYFREHCDQGLDITVSEDDLRLACGVTPEALNDILNEFSRLGLLVRNDECLRISSVVGKFVPSRYAVNRLEELETFVRTRVVKERRTRLLSAIRSARKEIPGVMLKAVLTLGGSSTEGQLVRAVALPWFRIVRLIERDRDAIYRIDPRTWEEIIAGAYTEAGFDEVVLTPRSGDKGRDVIATKHGVGSVRFFDQVKAYRPGHVVTAEEVRAMLGVITGAQNVSKGIITTTSSFAPRIGQDQFIRPYLPFRLELKARDELLSWLESLVDGTQHG